MKVQDLAIIFIIIILPISLVIATYTQFQIQTINTQTLYDSKLTSATYDAIRAFQINTETSTTSDMTNSKLRDLEASVSTFRNTIKSTFSLAGYSDDAVDRFVPALVYTLYDGFYIYSPYKNIVDENGKITNDDSVSSQYGLKPYISYSCRYTRGDIDVVITYSLDNHISVQGKIGNKYYNKDGYLIENIRYNGSTVTYNDVVIGNEQIKQYLPLNGNDDEIYKCIKLNGTTYYDDTNKKRIIARLNDTLTIQCDGTKNPDKYEEWVNLIENNSLAKDYYIDAYEFTNWFKSSGLDSLTYGDAIDTIIDSDGNISSGKLWTNSDEKIFKFGSTQNIENELSSFNEHRLSIIRHKIEVNLAIAISNYNTYMGASNVFQMPKLNEEEWYNITHNISLISFLQGLPIGGKTYNGYALVTNSESKEVVLENNIYILGKDTDGNPQYYKVGDHGISDGSVSIVADKYSADGGAKSAGRINLDFERSTLINSDSTKTYYYYPLKDNDASYNSVIMQNDVNTYDDIYAYVNSKSNDLKVAFYTALGRERAGTYKKESDYIQSSIGLTTNRGESENDNNANKTWTISYNVDGVVLRQQTVKNGQDIGVVSVDAKYIKDVANFKGWTDGIKLYRPGEVIRNVTSNITLTPAYEEEIATTYEITYKANGGYWDLSNSESGELEPQEEQTITVNSSGSVTLNPEEGNPVRDGFRFVGWATSADRAERRIVDYEPNAEYTQKQAITLWAIWRLEV